MSEVPEPEQLHRDLEELIVDGYARMYLDREPALALIRADRAATARAVLDELRVLAQTNKWVGDGGNGGKEAAWGRAYQEAMKELQAKHKESK